MWWRKKQQEKAEALLVDLQHGAILKAHRTADGAKIHRLHRHRIDETATKSTSVDVAIIRYLEKQKLIQSNMKFPAATYLLTEQGAARAQRIDESLTKPLTIRTVVAENKIK